MIPCQGPGAACRSCDRAGESLSTPNVCRSEDPQGFILQAEVFVTNKGEQQQRGVWCLVKVGNLLCASTSGTGWWCRTLGPRSCAEINSIPTNVQG